MKTFLTLLALCVGNSPVTFPHKGQWCRALMFSLICTWINGWVNNHEADDLGRLRTHYGVIVMDTLESCDLLTLLINGNYSLNIVLHKGISFDVWFINKQVLEEMTINQPLSTNHMMRDCHSSYASDDKPSKISKWWDYGMPVGKSQKGHHQLRKQHDDVIKWKHFPRNWPLVRGIPQSPVNSLHKGQWCGALMFFFVGVWIIGWLNNREAGDLRRYRVHSDVVLMT